LLNEGLRNLHCTPDFGKVTKLWEMRQVHHVARIYDEKVLGNFGLRNWRE